MWLHVACIREKNMAGEQFHDANRALVEEVTLNNCCKNINHCR